MGSNPIGDTNYFKTTSAFRAAKTYSALFFDDPVIRNEVTAEKSVRLEMGFAACLQPHLFYTVLLMFTAR